MQHSNNNSFSETNTMYSNALQRVSKNHSAYSVEAVTESDIIPLDKRIAKSREALRCAFISLMEEHGLDAITIHDLCTTAGINRTTFYNHFKDKDQLLSYFEQDVLKRLEAFQPRIASLSVAELFACSLTKRPPHALIDLFALLGSEGDLLHALLGDGGDPAFSRALNEVVCVNIVRSVLHKKYREHPSVFVEYYISFYATAYLGVITRWILTGRHESAEEKECSVRD